MEPSLFDPPAIPDAFDTLWASWPRKDAKAYSRDCYVKACRKAYPDVIAAGVQSFLARNKDTDKQFIPHFSTWLNQKRWLDEEPKTPENAKAKQDARLDSVAWYVKRKLHSTSVSLHEVEQAYRAGKVTAEECRAYGVRV